MHGKREINTLNCKKRWSEWDSKYKAGAKTKDLSIEYGYHVSTILYGIRKHRNII